MNSYLSWNDFPLGQELLTAAIFNVLREVWKPTIKSQTILQPLQNSRFLVWLYFNSFFSLLPNSFEILSRQIVYYLEE